MSNGTKLVVGFLMVLALGAAGFYLYLGKSSDYEVLGGDRQMVDLPDHEEAMRRAAELEAKAKAAAEAEAKKKAAEGAGEQPKDGGAAEPAVGEKDSGGEKAGDPTP